MRAKLSLVDRFFKVLVEEIRKESPSYLTSSFTVAEIYQSLVPYRTHRDRIGAEMNGDYEDALLKLLAGEGNYLRLESETARERIRLELRSSNPNTGLYREYAAVGVRLNPDAVAGASTGGAPIVDQDDDDLDLDDLLGEVAEVIGEADADEASPPVEEAGAKPAPSVAEPETQEVRSPAPAASSARTEDANGVNRGEKAASDREPEVAAARAEIDPASRPDGCPDCDNELPERDSLRFCPFCGTNVFVAPCGSCGEVLERSWSFCIACGSAAG